MRAPGRRPYSLGIDHIPFVEPDRYPELTVVGARWQEVRDEAIRALPQMTFVGDRRVDERSWSVLPLRVEADDRAVFPDDVCAANRTLAPVTVALIEGLGRIEAFSFSVLAPGASIAEHRHHRRFFTACLCLAGGESASLRVGGETRPYVDGEWLIFDYTQPHAVANRGTRPRVVLLVLLDVRN